MSRTQKPDLKIIEPYDVSFAEIRADGNWAETVQKVATAINVQFTESSEQLPFVPPRQFPNLLREEKVFLFGPSGCGKSRTIIELLKNKNASYGRIFVINPSNPAGLDSGRENIAALSQQFGQNDLVIWDNFPEGLVKRDLENAFGALEIVNSRPVQNLYIALKPTYLEMYRGLTVGIPDIYTYEITCNLETMKALIKAYGKVEQYRHVFERYVSANTDRIAKVLWQKQPLSLTVVDFYKALADKAQAGVDESAVLEMAEKWLPVYDYFERQFGVMKNISSRKRDVEFLYVMRLCYEVGFDRTQDAIASLQKGIFGSDPPAEPTQALGTWLYLSGQNYAMHDSAKNAVRLTDYSRMKITSYLADNFLTIVPKGDGELHSLGLFIGKNIQFMSNDTERPSIVPEQIYRFMKKKAAFERAIGQGVGDNFELLDDGLQELILQFVDTELEFGVGLADSLGERFIELDDNNRKRVLEKIYHSMLFARYLGQSVGRLYGRLSPELRSLVMSHSEKNPQFADGLGMGLGYVYATLDSALQREIMGKAQKSFEISRGLGFGFGLTFALLQEDDARKMVSLADNNSELDTGFGMGMAVSYSRLPDALRRLVLDRVAADCEFAFGAGIYGAFFYKESCPAELFELMHSNTEVSYGLGLGYGTIFFYLSETFQAKLDSLLKSDVKLDDGFGSGMGLVLKHLPAQAQDAFFDKASSSNAFATGLGYGLGYTWQYIGDALRKKATAIANSNSGFARGLGIGLGCHLDYLKHAYLDEVISIADGNSELDRGLGSGAAWAWPYYSDDARRITDERMDARAEFARGMGFGLARVVRHFSIDKREKLLGRLSRDPFFAEGFGEGTGQYLWSVYDEDSRQKFLKQATESAEISKGLGEGIGYLYSYFNGELGSDSYKSLLKINPDLRRGLGVGIGRAYKYLPEDTRSEVFHMAEDDVEFATGLGEGVGSVYSYLDGPQKELVLSYLGDSGFSRGLGIGLGLVFPYLGEDQKNEILARGAKIEQLSLGLGAGLGMHISYLSHVAASKIFDLAKYNPFLASGLGEGCAAVFSHLSEAEKDRLSRHVSSIDGFAFGFGTGIGKIRKYLEHRKFEEATSFARADGFGEGLAIGLGSAASHLPRDMLVDIISKSDDFARNFGFGLGHIFSVLDGGKRKDIFEAAKGNEEFLSGLGEGTGHYLPATGSRPIEEIMRAIDSVNLAKGTALGISRSFRYLGLDGALGVLEYASSRAEYGEALGRGLAEKFATFDQERQSQILGALSKENDFSRAFAKAIPGQMAHLSAQSRQMLKELATKHPYLSSALEEKRTG